MMRWLIALGLTACTASAESVPPASHSPATAVIPKGTGWWCFHVEITSGTHSVCDRTKDDCNGQRNVLIVDKPKSECQQREEAACFTAVHPGGHAFAQCLETMDACVRRLAWWRTDPHGDHDFSRCETIR
jgi:hypothetical protein